MNLRQLLFFRKKTAKFRFLNKITSESGLHPVVSMPEKIVNQGKNAMMKANPYFVYKFGGTSVSDAERIREVVRLVVKTPHEGRKVVVASALGKLKDDPNPKVTDQLLMCIALAQDRDTGYNTVLEQLQSRHEAILQTLVSDTADQNAIRTHLGTLWHYLGELLDGVYLLRECSSRTWAAIVAMGERLSVPIIAGAFRAAGYKAIAIEATQLIRTGPQFLEAEVDFRMSGELIRKNLWSLGDEIIPIVTGFIGATEDGVLTTLGRSGSDYSATILAYALDAKEVVIWSDVDGVLTADPRIVPDAFPLANLTYQEASELAYFGANVLHPRTMLPLIEKSIPLRSKNTLNPDHPGTLISTDTQDTPSKVKGVTSIRDMALLMVEGSGLAGVPGITARGFVSLADAGINVVMVSQASSEQSVCFAVRQTDAKTAHQRLLDAFARELDRGEVAEVSRRDGCAVVAIVGDNMRNSPGIAGKMMQALGKCGINILSIAQGASERNISVAVLDRDAVPAVQVLHETFAMNRRRVHLFQIGTGVVGQTMLQLLKKQDEYLRNMLRLNFRIVGVANSRQMFFDPKGVTHDAVDERLDMGDPSNLDKIISHFKENRLEHAVVIDITASEKVARMYPKFLAAGIAVVTPNKRANTLEQSFYDEIYRVYSQNPVPYFYETTVGAGLPIISTLRDLVETGDQINRIEGVLSGTLAYIFNRMSEGVTFSKALFEARDLGYTEPDPRDDLMGEDVARKIVILAREAGFRLNLEDVVQESLVPKAYRTLSVEEFMEKVPELDAGWQARMAEWQAQGLRPQYVGVINGDGSCSVGIQAVDVDSPLHYLRGTDNIVSFNTQRYFNTPMVVRGPGAGPELTSSIILADTIKTAETFR